MAAASLLESALQRPLLAVFTVLVFAIVTTRIYNLFFHPLARFPGPWMRAAFVWPHHYTEVTGTAPGTLYELHEKYGPVVRFAPDSLSFIGAQAYKDIFGFKPDRTQISKDYKRAPNAESLKHFLPLVLSSDADHTRLRRVIAHAFSETALREQEGIIQGHITRFCDGLRKLAEDSSARPDINMWNDWLSFDVLSDLTYGESFDSIKDQKTHKFITETTNGSQFSPVIGLTWDYFPMTILLRSLLVFAKVKQLIDGGESITDDQIQRRIDQGADARNDFMKYIIRNNTNDSKTALSMPEIRGLTTVFMAAGGEEPATAVATTLYYLLQCPNALERLQKELRDMYDSSEEITFASVEKLNYLNAIIQESLRIHPPNSAHNSRRTAKFETIDGFVVPPNTAVEVASYAATRSKKNFAEPDVFIPERWLEDAPLKFANDVKDAAQPFLVGPRACIGKNLALMMVRTTLARLLWQFDIEMDTPEQRWLDQKYRIIWNRPELKVKLTQRRV